MSTPSMEGAAPADIDVGVHKGLLRGQSARKRRIAVGLCFTAMIVLIATPAIMVPLLINAQQADMASTAESPYQSFADFTDALDSNRTYAEILSSPQAQGSYVVRDEAAFEEMMAHIRDTYAGVNTTHTYLDGRHIDCILVESQPALRKHGLSAPATPPPDVPGSKANSVARTVRSSYDRHGNLRACPTGTIPMRRLEVDRLLRYETLAHFFARHPSDVASPGGSRMPGRTLYADYHKYAHASKTVDNFGGQSTMALENPQGLFTLSQFWFVAGEDNTTQTAEGGWQHNTYEPWSPYALFVYATNAGYSTGSGCYNLDCHNFVQVHNSFTLGASFAQSEASTVGGSQWETPLEYKLYKGNWWFRVNGVWLGYYPVSVYKGGQMAQHATRIDFGGEVCNGGGSGTWPQMGSGEFASSGYGYAAYHRNITYHGTDGSLYWASGLTPYESDTSCWTIDYHDEQDTSIWGTYFFYGGPGGDCGDGGGAAARD